MGTAERAIWRIGAVYGRIRSSISDMADSGELVEMVARGKGWVGMAAEAEDAVTEAILAARE